MTEKTGEETGITLKNQIRAKKIAEGLINGKTYTQIAEDLEISRNTLYAAMDKQQVKDLMILEIREYETTLQHWIQELHNSPSPANQRTAVQELAKMVKHVQDKAYPSIFRTETVNININLTQLQQQQQLHEETLARLPPQIHQQYWTTYNQVKKEWNIS